MYDKKTIKKRDQMFLISLPKVTIIVYFSELLKDEKLINDSYKCFLAMDVEWKVQ